MKLPSDKSANQDIMAIDPEFGRMAVQVGSEVWGLAELSPKECAFLCLTADVCHQILDLPFQLHVDRAVVASKSPRQTPFHCIAPGISPLALRNDIFAFNYRTQI